MATRIHPCSSSSFKHDIHIPTRRFTIASSRTYRTSKWVSQISSRIHAKRHLELKASNGYPLNAVPLQDGNPLTEDHIAPQLKERPFISGSESPESTLSITVVGASGDLAKKKIFPALFALFYEDWLPENFTVFGYARTKMTDEELRDMISKTLTCRIDKSANCGDKMDQFLKRCFYHSGQYSSEEHFAELDKKLKEKEAC